MSLKEKMAFIMAIILAINLVPFNVQKAFASVQSHKGDDVVKYTGEPIYYYNEKPYYNEEDVHRPSVKIYPTDEIQYNETNPSGNSVFITIENAKFDFEYYHIPDYKAYLDEYNGNDYYYNYEGRIFSYNELFDNLSQNAQNVVDDQTKEQAVIDAYSEMQNSICSELPWFIKIISDTQ
ncbi:MAG: hypothetical protein IJR59_06100, partial [Firmicutes bacterium]|nr:hypothetical protein [Bacillota bacterium]